MTLMRCFHLRSRQYSVPWAVRTRIDETAVIDSTEVLDGVSKKEARVRHGAGRRGCRVAARKHGHTSRSEPPAQFSRSSVMCRAGEGDEAAMRACDEERVLDVRGPRIDERHVLAGLYHMGADIAAHRTRSGQWLSSGSHFPPGILGDANASTTRYG